MSVIGQHISTDQFYYHSDIKTFTQEASTLRGLRFLGRLYNDAADTGFVLVSHKTGKAIPFYLDHTGKDLDGDTFVWAFKPAEPVPPQLRDVCVKIFND